ncbi:LPS export ABC transporter periplasmic protein LptC [Tahibacter soli]|uniref:LPS export ABC transporter periplasmic protein LptC n=1 Tax=Tahibacter soli TaxID=2983605 RepID=A0A9X3YGZ4_9GAMM|nr:LPS export ABC transporter periplasmic protein LptC [Tahibacter soli]MDC8012051.1 LPS export ABC transporter periplasmic protein LptC [Tahibacter soli]
MALTERPVLLVALLALGAIATQALVWLVRPTPEPPAFVGPPRSNYSLADFTLNSLDDQGRLSFTIVAPALARRNDDGSLWVDAPNFTITSNDGSENWKGVSDSAWVTKDGTKMLLAGKVQMHRDTEDPKRQAQVDTHDVTAWPKQNKLETQAPATITQPGSILRGTGMKADLNTHQLELLADVHATFAPKRKP